jgi:Tripartite tricarboxylate transporter TctB family
MSTGADPKVHGSKVQGSKVHGSKIHGSKVQGYWGEEFSLIAILLLFFIGIVALCYDTPFDARLFPLIIGSAGIVLTLLIAVEEIRRRRVAGAPVVDHADPAANASWPRYATALLAAPLFGVAFWLFGFMVASLAAMLLMPVLMGYRNLRHLVPIAVVTVAVLALICPYLLNVDLPHGLVGDWLIDTFLPHAG